MYPLFEGSFFTNENNRVKNHFLSTYNFFFTIMPVLRINILFRLCVFKAKAEIIRHCVYLLLILLLSGNIELNPGPVKIIKVVKGNFHESDSRFGDIGGS